MVPKLLNTLLLICHALVPNRKSQKPNPGNWGNLDSYIQNTCQK